MEKVKHTEPTTPPESLGDATARITAHGNAQREADQAALWTARAAEAENIKTAQTRLREILDFGAQHGEDVQKAKAILEEAELRGDRLLGFRVERARRPVLALAGILAMVPRQIETLIRNVETADNVDDLASAAAALRSYVRSQCVRPLDLATQLAAATVEVTAIAHAIKHLPPLAPRPAPVSVGFPEPRPKAHDAITAFNVFEYDKGVSR